MMLAEEINRINEYISGFNEGLPRLPNSSNFIILSKYHEYDDAVMICWTIGGPQSFGMDKVKTLEEAMNVVTSVINDYYSYLGKRQLEDDQWRKK